MLNPDFRDILLAFEEEEVEYLVVGAYALAAQGIPRATGDLDLWVHSSQENARSVLRALSRFGAPSQSITEADLATEDLVFQIGISPRRIDILTSITGVPFTNAWSRRLNIRMDGIQVSVIGREDLIENKRATARPQDLLDVEKLLKL